MEKIQELKNKAQEVDPIKMAGVILCVTFISWAVFAFGGWNRNLLVMILSVTIPAVVFRVLFDRKMFNRDECVLLVLFGVFLWNHWIFAALLLVAATFLYYEKFRK